MTLLNNKFVKVDYPNPNALHIYQRIKVMGRKLFRIPKLIPFTRQLISVTKPVGQISILKGPPAVRVFPRENEITILSANLCHDWPRNRRLIGRLECFAELVERQRVDVLLLQELARTEKLYADEWLGERLGMAYVYSRANGDVKNIKFEEGLGIFSRFPIEKPRLAHLSDHINPFHRRIALGASIHTNIGEIVAFSVHLGIMNRKNQIQVSNLRKWVADQSQGFPAIIGGDFNADEHTPQIRSAQIEWSDSFREINPDKVGHTHQIKWPWGEIFRRSRLDYLFFRRGNHKWRIEDAQHIESDECSISDHKPVLATAGLFN